MGPYRKDAYTHFLELGYRIPTAQAYGIKNSITTDFRQHTLDSEGGSWYLVPHLTSLIKVTRLFTCI